MNITHKRILVTGASDGIGRSIVARLAREDVTLLLLARNENKLQTLAEEVQALGSKAEVYVCDLTDQDQLQTTSQKILQAGGVDVLINNAGVWQKMGDVTTVGFDAIDQVIATDLTGQIKLTSLLLDNLKYKESAIVNVISKSGVVAQAGQSVYTAAKYGMRGFTDVLRVDLKDSSVHIAAVYQSGTDTDFFKKTDENFDQSHLTSPDDLADAISYMLKTPAKMWIAELHVNYR